VTKYLHQKVNNKQQRECLITHRIGRLVTCNSTAGIR